MTDARGVSRVARVIADESRAAMCLALLDGSAWTVTELAGAAGISMATASEHVSKLVAAKLATEERAGRNRYVRLAGPEIAQVLEALTALATPAPPTSLRTVGQRRRLAAARTCYDHLAGRLGVAVLDALLAQDLMESSSGLTVTSRGKSWFAEVGVDIGDLRSQRRTFVRECLDWTERRPHLAGSLGAAVCEKFLDEQWVRRPDRTRRLETTAPGLRALHDLLGIEPADLRAA